MLSHRIALVLLSILAFKRTILAQRSSSDCGGLTEIYFLGVFPCHRDSQSNFVASKNISECDLLAEAAARLAVERVNRDPDILPNIILNLFPVYVSTDEVL